MTKPSTGRGTARDRAYQLLRQQIVTLDLPPGTALSENELATSLGVSRTPIREALLLLTRDGLVQVFPKIGSFVSRVDPDQVAEAQFLREAVEVASLHSLTYPLPADGLDRLTRNLAQQDESTTDVAAFFGLDEDFHAALMDLAGHRGTWESVRHAKTHLDRARSLGLRLVSSVAHLVEDHRAIFDAVLAKDLDRAEARMREHLRLVFSDVTSMREISPELFASDSAPVRRSIAVWN